MKKQPIQVVMLPTKDLTNIIKRGDDNSLVYYELPNEANVTHSNQHLYITISQDIEHIKEGDYVIDGLGELFGPYEKGDIIENGRKIIASTDKTLTFKKPFENPAVSLAMRTGLVGTHYHTLLPQLPQSFLKEYCSSPDGEWEVEYETAGNWVNCKINSEKLGEECKRCGELNYASDLECECGFKLKLNQDNTVNITAVKEKMYSLEDLYLSAANVVDQIAANRGNSDWNINTTPKMIVDNWIKNVDN